MKFCVVVLHYYAYEMTIQCVDSILKNQNQEDYHIIVVDNGSKNNSGKQLKKHYDNNEKVTVLISNENLGFSSGNNIGYEYAKKMFNPDYIMVINNDVIIDDAMIFQKINKIYEEERFAVLGPDIYNPNSNIHQNPARKKARDRYETDLRIKKYAKYCKYPTVYYLRSLVGGYFKKLFDMDKAENSHGISKKDVGVVLHGACLIFSKLFIDERSYCFNPRTFMYMEEDILYIECKQQNLKMLYDPSIIVNHYEDVSTNTSMSNSYFRERFKNEQMLQSTRIYRDILEMMEEGS